MDLDFFKQYNDNYGHLAGDDCLRQVAGCLKGVVRRPGDMIARYGGEEFACILPNTDTQGAMMLAHTMRKRVYDHGVCHAYSSVSDLVTLSYGVATLIPERGQPPSDLVRLADSLLYSAKENGRDRIVSERGTARASR
jgi:diguanylate cyclase (GGDEF)-like protein